MPMNAPSPNAPIQPNELPLAVLAMTKAMEPASAPATAATIRVIGVWIMSQHGPSVTLQQSTLERPQWVDSGHHGDAANQTFDSARIT